MASCLVHNPAVADEHHAVRPRGMAGLVRDQHDGGAGVSPGAEHLHHAVAGGGVKRAGGFVGEDQPAAPDDGACDGHALLLPAGHFIHEPVRELRDPHLPQGIQRLPVRFLGRHAVELERQGDIFRGRQGRHQVEVLEDVAHRTAAEPCQRVQSQTRQRR
jgi:hypothetical protein